MLSFQRILGLTVVFAFGAGLARAQAETSLAPRGASRDARPSPKTVTPDLRAKAAPSVQSFTSLPLRFEANQGQTDERVEFLSRGQGYTLFLADGEAVLSLSSRQSAVGSRQTTADGNLKLETGNGKPETGKSKSENRKAEDGGKPQIQNPKSKIQNSRFPSPESQVPTILRMKLVGAQAAKAVGVEPLASNSNYFIGNDPKKWRRNVPNYARVKYEGVYPGIDLIYYGKEAGGRSQESGVTLRQAQGPERSRGGSQGSEGEGGAIAGGRGQLEFDFVVAPGADPKAIAFEIETGNRKSETGNSQFENRSSRTSAESKIQNLKSKIDEGSGPVRVDANGDLVIATEAGEVRFRKPVVYQEQSAVSSRQSAVNNPQLITHNPRPTTSALNRQSSIDKRQFIEGRYVLAANYQVRFEVPAYDKSRPLIIDPVLSYSTFLGGANTDAGYGIAADDAGNVFVAGTTVSVNFPTKTPFQTVSGGNFDVFVTKIDPTGAALVYSTYLGGSGSDRVTGMALDGSGSIHIGGTTTSTNFPTTASGFQRTPGGGTCGTEACSDAFVAKVKPDGTGLDYSTYLGGSSADLAAGIVLDSEGNVYIAGATESINFPTAAALQPALAGAADAFLTKLNPGGTVLVYSTYLGGSATDNGQAIAVDSSGNATVAGYTFSTDFPTASPLQGASGGMSDVFITEINPAGDALVFSTYLGGAGKDHARAVALDGSGNVHVGGDTTSADFPVSAGAFQMALAAGTCGASPCADGFLAKLDPAGAATLFSTYLGGTDLDQVSAITVSAAGQAFVTGSTGSADFPLVNPLQSAFGGGTCSPNSCPDAFVARLDATGSPLVYSTYLGGNAADSGHAIFVDASDNAYVTGLTGSGNFPATPAAFQTAPGATSSSGDAFVVKIGPADASALLFSPLKLTFTDQPQGFASDAQTITLTNAGTATITFAGIVVSGDFAQTNTCEPTLAVASASCTVNVTFTPTATGDRTGEITLTSDASGSPHKISLAGKGIEAKSAITFSPIPIEFPDQDVETTSAPLAVTVTDTGFADITITKVEVTGNYAQTNDCPLSPNKLVVGAFCTVTVTFTPEGSGVRSGSLSVTSDSGNATSGVNSIGLTGEGIAEFTLSAPTTSTTVKRGTASTTFTINAAGPGTFEGAIALTCQNSSGACSFNPASIKVGEASTLTVSNLNQITAETTTITVRGTNALQFAEVAVSITFSDFSLAPKPTFGTVSSGDSFTMQVTMTSRNGFDGSASFTCSGLPQESSCTFNPATVTLDGTSTPAVEVTIKTTTRVTTWTPPRPPSPLNPWLTGGLGLLVLCFVVGARRRRVRLALLAAVLLALLFLGSCNDYYYYEYSGTLPGTFGVVINAKVGEVNHTTTFFLTVL